MIANLDYQAMQCAGEILESCKKYSGDEVENLATKGLGVVLEQGVYAGLLYFYSQRDLDEHGNSKASPADAFVQHLLGLAGNAIPNGVTPLQWRQPLPCLKYLADTVCADLHGTLLVKTMWEQALTYVRYGAKSLKKAGEEGKV